MSLGRGEGGIDFSGKKRRIKRENKISLREVKYLPWEGRGRSRFLGRQMDDKRENENLPKGGKLSPLGGEREKLIPQAEKGE